MKKIYAFTFLLLFAIGNSQTYSFDFLTKYIAVGKNEKVQNEVVNYFNTDNFNYYLRLLRGSENFYAYLTDEEQNKVHEFEVTEIKNGKGIIFSFKYIKTNSLHKHPISQNHYRYEWSNKSNTGATLKIFKTRKAKKPSEEYQFSFKKANKNLFPVFRIAIMHPFENEKNINIDENLIVEKAKYTCNYPPCSCDFRLAEYKNVSLELTVPQ